MPGIRGALRFFTQASPSSPGSGQVATWMSAGTVPRLMTRTSAGVERAVPYEAVFNVKDYGATGDGVANDAPGIQAAIDAANAAGGGTVLIPHGTYLINAELEITGSNICIRCEYRATIRRNSASMQYMLKNFNAGYAPTGWAGRGDVAVEGGTWDANGQTLTGSCTAIIFAHCANVRVRNVTVLNVRDWHGVELNAVREGIVENCQFSGFNPVAANRDMSEAIQIDLAVNSSALPGIGAGAYDNTPCSNILVTGNYVSGLGALGSYGKLVGSHSAVQDKGHTSIRVIGNVAENLNDYGVTAYNWYNTIVEANTFLNCNGGVLIEVPSGLTVDIERFTVTGNQFINAGTLNNGAAVEASVIETRMSGSAVIRSVTIMGNQIKNFANATGIKIQTSSDVICSYNSVRNGTNGSSVAIRVNNSALGIYQGNKVDGMNDTGMIFENVSTECAITGTVMTTNAGGIQLASIRCTVMGNILRINSLDGFGIQLTSAADESVIVGNSIRQTVPGTKTQAGIDVDAAQDVVLQNNWIKGWGTTEGAAGPVNRGGTLFPNIGTTIGTTNLNAYQA